jgi:hypothetical protein
MDQVFIKYTNIFQCKTLPKFTQIWIFGLKTNHLATLDPTSIKGENDRSKTVQKYFGKKSVLFRAVVSLEKCTFRPDFMCYHDDQCAKIT